VAAAEEAVRHTPADEHVTILLTTSDPAETSRLLSLRIGDLLGTLREVFAPDDWPRFTLVLADTDSVAPIAGRPDTGDETETALRIRNGIVVARSHGRGAAYAAAIATVPSA
jgi:hypothetical protein